MHFGNSVDEVCTDLNIYCIINNVWFYIDHTQIHTTYQHRATRTVNSHSMRYLKTILLIYNIDTLRYLGGYNNCVSVVVAVRHV